MSDIVLRDLSGMAEMQAAEALQRRVWGEGDKEDPADLMMVIQHEGGLVAGAFDGPRLVAYLFAFPTASPGIQHSHRLAVDPDWRGKGLAARLKFYQRDWCRARGIDLVRWTFDPLRHVNAALNIGRLGALARVYHEDYYGAMAGINSGPPSDRLLAEWHIGPAGAPETGPRTGPVTRRIGVPRDIDALLRDRPDEALAERLRMRTELTRAFAEGLIIAGYEASEAAYLLAPLRG